MFNYGSLPCINAYPFYCCIFALVHVLLGLLSILHNVDYYLSKSIEPHQIFDFIVVGGGSAGCLLATRLSSVPEISVLLLEAGLSKPTLFDIPALGPVLQMSSLDWQYGTVPQVNACKALKDQRSRWPLGKVLGGTTHLNYMLHVPGHLDDLACWTDDELHWTEGDIVKYLRRAENGMQLREVPHTTNLSMALQMAAEQLSIPWGPLDSNTTHGFARPLVTMDPGGTRWTADKYLSDRPNLTVKKGVTVRRVLTRNKQAYGVEIEEGGQVLTVRVKKEILLTAGTVNSAQLLMLSGIGPADILANAKIPVVHDLPVGQNLQDHVTTGLDLILSERPTFGLGDLTSPLSAALYLAYGTGPFSSSLCEAVGMFPAKSTDFARSRHAPSIQIMAMMAGAASDRGLLSRHALGIKDQVWAEYWEPLLDRQTVSLMPVLLRPQSRGQVTLDPGDPWGPPLVDPRYLTHPDDVVTLIEGLQLVHSIADTTAMRDMGFSMNRQVFPGCENAGDFGSESYWTCYVQQFTLTTYHPVGTCAIGSVVDSHLRVMGVGGIRVADASVMPSLPGGNPHAAVALIAHKAADLIAGMVLNATKHSRGDTACGAEFRIETYPCRQCTCT